MVTSDAATTGEKELRRDWPNVSGITAGTTKTEGRKPHLKPEEQDLTSDKEGL